MNYIKLINAFYDRLETNPLSTSAIALWHALMHVNNKAGWQREFTVAVSVLCVKTGLSERTITNARNDLKVKGYLDFRSRKGSKSAIYMMNDLSESIAYKITDKDSLSEMISDNVSDNLSDNVSDNLSNNVSALNKLNKTKQNETKIAAATRVNFFDEYMLAFNRQPTPIQVEEINSFIDKGGLTDEAICAAFKKAAENGAGYPYARSIINSWAKKGIRTLDDVNREQADFESKRRQRRGQAPIRKELIPDWFDENPYSNEQKQTVSDHEVSEDHKKEMQDILKSIRSS